MVKGKFLAQVGLATREALLSYQVGAAGSYLRGEQAATVQRSVGPPEPNGSGSNSFLQGCASCDPSDGDRTSATTGGSKGGKRKASDDESQERSRQAEEERKKARKARRKAVRSSRGGKDDDREPEDDSEETGDSEGDAGAAAQRSDRHGRDDKKQDDKDMRSSTGQNDDKKSKKEAAPLSSAGKEAEAASGDGDIVPDFLVHVRKWRLREPTMMDDEAWIKDLKERGPAFLREDLTRPGGPRSRESELIYGYIRSHFVNTTGKDHLNDLYTHLVDENNMCEKPFPNKEERFGRTKELSLEELNKDYFEQAEKNFRHATDVLSFLLNAPELQPGPTAAGAATAAGEDKNEDDKLLVLQARLRKVEETLEKEKPLPEENRPKFLEKCWTNETEQVTNALFSEFAATQTPDERWVADLFQPQVTALVTKYEPYKDIKEGSITYIVPQVTSKLVTESRFQLCFDFDGKNSIRKKFLRDGKHPLHMEEKLANDLGNPDEKDEQYKYVQELSDRLAVIRKNCDEADKVTKFLEENPIIKKAATDKESKVAKGLGNLRVIVDRRKLEVPK